MPHSTSYARLTPSRARLVLAAIVAAAVLAVAVTVSPLASSNLRAGVKGKNDVALYQAEVERIQRGQGYYEAAAAELAPRGYPTRSVFNWRMPLPMWLLGKLPVAWFGKLLLGGLSLLLAVMALQALGREQHGGPNDSCKEPSSASGLGICTVAMTLLLLNGPLMLTVLDDLYVVPVLWAGVFLGLSVSAFGLNRPYLGVGLGIAAVFFRELALPYCLLGAAIAWWRGRRGELLAWLLGLTTWCIFFALHCWHVSGLIGPEARAHQHGWIQFGGAGFVISTVQMNAYLLVLPQWVTALYLVAALVGFAGWNTPLGVRMGLSACLFLAAFAAVGQSFNQYWGSLIAPLLCFGAARFPASITEICRAAAKGRAWNLPSELRAGTD
ncbi:MAG: hypothetical protein ABFC63_05265 [Thermoguttaceae bacterium]